MQRAYFIDRLRVLLTALVVFHHTAITYGAPGGWYYREQPVTLSLSGVLLILFVSINQAYFMGFFFLIAGYFTPGSYDRKGPCLFAKDRLLRLGIPLLVFVLLLDPLTIAMMVAWSGQYAPAPRFGAYLLRRLLHPGWGTGPLWFAEALLIFSAGYMAWRAWTKKPLPAPEAPLPGWWTWLASALGVGAVALLLRQWVPVGKDVIGLQLGYFASYVFLFALGTVAWRRNWLMRLTGRMARPWIAMSVLMWPVMVITVAIAQRTTKALPEVNTGFSWPAVVYAFWEPLIAWGILAGLIVWFRERGNRASKAWEFCSARAYAVYIVHAPVLVAVALLLRGWDGPALGKVAVTGTVACVMSLGVASLVMMMPGAKRVL
jgi:fucose 4-O-acetylase-like acetyltransferase